MPMKFVTALLIVSASLSVSHVAEGAFLYSNGFETNVSDWDAFGGSFNATRVPSGTNGITSASGSFHAVSSASGSASRWGGYNYGAGNAVATVFQEYITSVDIHFDVNASLANDTRFDFSSAINNAAGTHLRDFIFNGGFYNDATGPGASTNRFVISASTNSQPGSAFAKNPANDPIAISTTGWYTFQHHFYDNGGVLAVDMSIYDSSSALINSWTRSNLADAIAGVGGNRYGWFAYNQLPVLAFDNASLETITTTPVPEPTALAMLFGFGFPLLAARLLRKKHAA